MFSISPPDGPRAWESTQPELALAVGQSLGMPPKVALGGIAAEYVTFGQANGGMSDLIQLEAQWQLRNMWNV